MPYTDLLLHICTCTQYNHIIWAIALTSISPFPPLPLALVLFLYSIGLPSIFMR